MAHSKSGVSDMAKVSIPNHREEWGKIWVSRMTPCPWCNEMRKPTNRWEPPKKPGVRCVNAECVGRKTGEKRRWLPDEWQHEGESHDEG